MTIKSTGRRGLFGLLAVAPVAVVTTGAEAAPVPSINIVVETVELRLCKVIERTYGLERRVR